MDVPPKRRYICTIFYIALFHIGIKRDSLYFVCCLSHSSILKMDVPPKRRYICTIFYIAVFQIRIKRDSTVLCFLFAPLFRPQDERSSETSVHLYHFLYCIISNSHKTRLHCTLLLVSPTLPPSRWTFLRNVGTFVPFFYIAVFQIRIKRDSTVLCFLLAPLFRPQDERSSETSVLLYHFLYCIISNSHKTRLHCTLLVVCLTLPSWWWTFLRNVGTYVPDYTATTVRAWDPHAHAFCCYAWRTGQPVAGRSCQSAFTF
jgi:hypothetical protein